MRCVGFLFIVSGELRYGRRIVFFGSTVVGPEVPHPLHACISGCIHEVGMVGIKPGVHHSHYHATSCERAYAVIAEVNAGVQQCGAAQSVALRKTLLLLAAERQAPYAGEGCKGFHAVNSYLDYRHISEVINHRVTFSLYLVR